MNYENDAHRPKREWSKKLKGADPKPSEAHEEISVAEQDQCLARMLKPDYPMDGSFLSSAVFLITAQVQSDGDGTAVNVILMVGKTESLQTRSLLPKLRLLESGDKFSVTRAVLPKIRA